MRSVATSQLQDSQDRSWAQVTLCVFHMSLCPCRFPPMSQKHTGTWTPGVNVCVHGSRWWTGFLSRVYSCLVTSVPMLSCGSTVNLTKMTWLLKMNERIRMTNDAVNRGTVSRWLVCYGVEQTIVLLLPLLALLSFRFPSLPLSVRLPDKSNRVITVSLMLRLLSKPVSSFLAQVTKRRESYQLSRTHRCNAVSLRCQECCWWMWQDAGRQPSVSPGSQSETAGDISQWNGNRPLDSHQEKLNKYEYVVYVVQLKPRTGKHLLMK